MARSKKTRSSLLAWRLINPQPAPNLDERRAELEEQVISHLLRCPEFGAQREFVAPEDVPADVREKLVQRMAVDDFVYCTPCASYSGMGSWDTF